MSHTELSKYIEPMHRRIFSLVAACLLPVASVSMAQDKSVPASQEKAAIQETAADLFASDSVTSLSTQKQISVVFGKLVQSYGVKNRLEIAKAVSELVPAEFHGHVAKRAISYSPVKAKEILAALSKNGTNSVGSAIGTLPSGSVHTAATASAVGFGLPERVFTLPQVNARRQIGSSIDADGTIIEADGQGDPDGPGPAPSTNLTATFGPTPDNGFTEKRMGYTIVDDADNLIGVYLVVVNNGDGTLTFSIKNDHADDPNPGTGGESVTIDAS